MLYEVVGVAGSGKTEYLYTVLEQAYRAGESCVWIAPEQQSVQAEREILARLGDASNLSVEILNFERLPERIARAYGDLAVTYPDRGALCALLSVLVHENRRSLRKYGDCAEDLPFLEGLYGMFGRLRSERVTPETLRKAIGSGLLESAALEEKLSDVALLYEAYDAYFDTTRRDPRDALTVLADELESKPFFVGKTVFVDGYYTFTGQELALLSGILRQAKAVYCSFTYDERELFETHKACADRLARSADRSERITLGSYRRSAREELCFLEKYLWETDNVQFAGNTDALRLVTAPNLFAESEAVASEILRLVRSGYRYREITVLTRHAEAYAGVLDAVLRQNKIPFFFSEKDVPLTKPLWSFVCASLELTVDRFSLASMRRYLKSGYSGLSPDSCDLLLRYADGWRIQGDAWYNDRPWTKNPDGFREGGMDEEQRATLQAVNTAREQLRPSLNALRETLSQASTGREILSALYAHLERVNAAERYTASVNRLLERGETEQAAKDSQLWELLMKLFEQLDSLCGETAMRGKAGLKRMLSLFRLTSGQYSLGSIPSSLDSVTVGDASLCRPDRARAVIAIGCNDGVFPGMAMTDPLFDETEAILLEGAGISIIEPRLHQLQEERFYFYNAVTSPSEQLILTYPTGTLSGEELRPSPAITRIRKLFPDLQESTYTGIGAQALFSAENAAAVFHTLPAHPDRDRLGEWLTEMGIPIPRASQALFAPEAHIGYRSDSVRFSPSGLERYRYCPFSYFGSNLLRLKEKKTNRFATPEIGTFLHKMLEQFLSAHTATGRFVPPVDCAQTEAEADELIRAYFAELGEDATEQNARFRHICRNLKKTLLTLLEDLCEEFTVSDFLPVGFEVGIGLPDSAYPAVCLPHGGGRRIYLCGSIDRVDRYDGKNASCIRVVDYKTYHKGFSLANVRSDGLDEQMLLYLFAYCAVAGKNELKPVGVLYHTALLPFAEATGEESEEQLHRARSEKLTRSGLILQDTEIALAMDKSASGRFVPVAFDGDGNVKAGKSTLTEEELEELRTVMLEQMHDTAERVFCGNMEIRPVQNDSEHDACRYCKFHAICRFTK